MDSKTRYFFTSDTHFGHRNIIKYCHRPFLSRADQEALDRLGSWHSGVWKGVDASNWQISDESVYLMNEALFDGINKTVGENDVLFHHGDFAMYGRHERMERYYTRCRGYRDRIKCRNVVLLWGNHDEDVISDLFTETDSVIQRFLPGVSSLFFMSHYAHFCWNKNHRMAIHLYGHSHSQAEAWLDRFTPGHRSMDVGVDNAAKILGEYRPFSLKEILAIMDKRPGFSFDHHVAEAMNTPEEHTLN